MLLFADGQELTLALSDHRLLMPPLPIRFTRHSAMEKRYGDSAEPVLQTFELPLADFRLAFGEAASAEVDFERLAGVRFVFDRTEEAVIALDRVGFWLAPELAGE